MNNTKKLEALIEQATMDCYDEDEQLSGFFSILEEELVLPFQTEVLGQPVMVERLEQGEFDILVRCSTGSHRQLLSLLHLPLPEPPPAGFEWVLAYRHWRG